MLGLSLSNFFSNAECHMQQCHIAAHMCKHRQTQTDLTQSKLGDHVLCIERSLVTRLKPIGDKQVSTPREREGRDGPLHYAGLATNMFDCYVAGGIHIYTFIYI